MKKAVILLSGGLDSATTLYLAKKSGWRCFCLFFDYGQRHKKEILSAQRITRLLKTPLKIIKIPLPWAKDSLIDKRKSLPRRKITHLPKTIPSTYVAGRNTIFLSFALSYAESIKGEAVFIGANILDWSGYPDCTPSYFKAWEKLVKEGTKAGRIGRKIKIKAPLIKKSKADIIKTGKKLGVPFHLTWSCYRGKDLPCGNCDSCKLRRKGFKEAGVTDPVIKKHGKQG